MIANDRELQATQERIAFFQGVLLNIRVRSRPEEFQAMSSGYLAEIERMHKVVMEYLGKHASDPQPATTDLPKELSQV